MDRAAGRAGQSDRLTANARADEHVADPAARAVQHLGGNAGPGYIRGRALDLVAMRSASAG